jgi:hypothetical protein
MLRNLGVEMLGLPEWDICTTTTAFTRVFPKYKRDPLLVVMSVVDWWKSL